MTGTTKQIEWAQDIIAGWARTMDKDVAEAKDRVARGSMPAVWAEFMETAAEEVKTVFAKAPSAKEIIDIKSVNYGKKAFEVASARYDELNK